MRLPGAQLSALNSTLPTIRNGEPMRNLEQEFVKAMARPHNLFGTDRLGTCVPGWKLPRTPFLRMFAAQHTIYSMNAGLKVAYLYHDGDIIEVRIVAENLSFRGSADVYVGTDGLLDAAAVLEGFPKDRQDTREVVFGAAGPKFAGGSARLKFYCKDGAGHTAFLAEIEEDYRDQEEHSVRPSAWIWSQLRWTDSSLSFGK